jgi:predicted nucleic acid-binding protein
MRPVLIDSSVWIEYFRDKDSIVGSEVDKLLDSDNIVLNDLILVELIPYLQIKKKNELIKILQAFEKLPINVDWDEVLRLQITNLKNGINKVGIPDLIILQNTIQNNVELFSKDRHFYLMRKTIRFNLYMNGHFG